MDKETICYLTNYPEATSTYFLCALYVADLEEEPCVLFRINKYLKALASDNDERNIMGPVIWDNAMQKRRENVRHVAQVHSFRILLF